MTPTESDNLATVRAYLAALETGADAETLARFFRADAVQIEHPNRLKPAGGRSDLATLLKRAAQMPTLVREQHYRIHSALAQGSRVAVEAEWNAVLATPIGALAAGARMHAFFAMFLELDGGRIVSQVNYDCFEPF